MANTDAKPASMANMKDLAQTTLSQETPSLYEDEQFTPEEQKRVLRRVDNRLVTMTGLIYCISLMDRTNLSMANIAG